MKKKKDDTVSPAAKTLYRRFTRRAPAPKLTAEDLDREIQQKIARVLRPFVGSPNTRTMREEMSRQIMVAVESAFPEVREKQSKEAVDKLLAYMKLPDDLKLEVQVLDNEPSLRRK